MDKVKWFEVRGMLMPDFLPYVEEIATELGLNGEVRRDSGDGMRLVSGEVQGSGEQIDQFENRLWKGPGRVDSVRFGPGADGSPYDSFTA